MNESEAAGTGFHGHPRRVLRPRMQSYLQIFRGRVTTR